MKGVVAADLILEYCDDQNGAIEYLKKTMDLGNQKTASHAKNILEMYSP